MRKQGITAVVAVLFAALLAMIVPPTAARAWGGGTTVSATPFQGGTITSTLTIKGVTTDITTGTNEDLTLAPNGTGQVQLKSGDNLVHFFAGASDRGNIHVDPASGSIMLQGAGSTDPLFRLSSGAEPDLGLGGTAAATARVGCFVKSANVTSSGTRVECAYGSGAGTVETVQTATCATGTVSVDPQSQVITVDAAAAACTLTVTTTSFTTIAQEGKPLRVTAKNVGAGTLKFASTNFASIPARCTGTGLTAGQSALIAWSQDQAKWTFLGGCE